MLIWLPSRFEIALAAALLAVFSATLRLAELLALTLGDLNMDRANIGLVVLFIFVSAVQLGLTAFPISRPRKTRRQLI